MKARQRIEPGDVRPSAAAAHLGLTLEQFEACKLSLFDRGFPESDPTTGNYDLDAIKEWRRSRYPRIFPAAPRLTPAGKPRDAREKLGA